MTWASAHGTIASCATWESVVAEATEVIGDLSVDEGVLRRFRLSPAILKESGWVPRTWVELALQQILGDPDLVSDALPAALEFHRRVADKASAHLALTVENIGRSHWLAAAVVHPDPTKAQAAAARLVRHLATTAPRARNAFEEHLFGDPVLYANLVDFSTARPPVCVWQGRRQFEPLLRLFGPQFLANPDHVLDCERVHARWQWLTQT